MLFTLYNDYLSLEKIKNVLNDYNTELLENALSKYHYVNYQIEDIEHIHEHKCRLFIRLEIKVNASYETEWSNELIELDIYKDDLDKEAKQYVS